MAAKSSQNVLSRWGLDPEPLLSRLTGTKGIKGIKAVKGVKAGKDGKGGKGIKGVNEVKSIKGDEDVEAVTGGELSKASTKKPARVIVALGNRKAQAGPPVKVIERDGNVEVVISLAAISDTENDPRLKSSLEVKTRDAVGSSLGLLEKLDVDWIDYELDLPPPLVSAALLGLEIGLYRFKRCVKGESFKFGVGVSSRGKAIADSIGRPAMIQGAAVNLARHLANLPGNWLNPETYAEWLQNWFEHKPSMKVEVWDEQRQAKENMNLLLAVGQGSKSKSRLVHLRYRPPGAPKTPIAFIGKGITFDSGGLDIKPSSGMRLMKKDMGGSAAIAGLAHWVVESRIKLAMDFYFALAENAVGANSYRPGDIIKSRNGQSVEIHNTDAEGRLVLADALDVAATQSERPRALVDVATLTGAIKVALGANIAGLFSNDQKLSKQLNEAGLRAGDLNWPMPLCERYRSQLSSNFADMANSSDGFGGAITAALFLEKFARDIPWAHLDIYAWKDSGDGAWLEPGGSGQAVLCLIAWLKALR